MESKKVSLKYGLILSAVIIVYSTILHAVGLGTNQAAGYIALLFVPVFIYLAAKKNQVVKDNYSFGNAFTSGLKVSVIAAILIPLFTYIYMAYIDSDIVQFIQDQAENELYARGFSDDQIEEAIKYQKMFMTPSAMSIMSAIMYFIVGLITSLIVAAIIKKPEDKIEY